MKKLPFLLFLSMIFICFSCKNEPQKSKAEILDHVIERLLTKIDNPESFELISFKVTDSTTWRESLNKSEKAQSKLASGVRKNIELTKINGVNKAKLSLDDLNEMLKRSEEQLASIDSHRNALGDDIDDIYMHEYELSFMLKNESGIKELENYNVFISNPLKELISIDNGKKYIIMDRKDPFIERVYPNL